MAVVMASSLALSLTDGVALAQTTGDQSDCAGVDGAYADASGSQAQVLFADTFPCILHELAVDPPDAQVDSGATTGETATTELPVTPAPPLRTMASSGGNMPVDLSLESADGGVQPANPLVDLNLPADLGNGVQIGDRGMAIDLGATEPDAAASANASPLAGEGLFYADAGPATDVVLAPTSQGLETVYQLRGAASPEHLQMNFTLPSDAYLEPAIAGGAQVVQAGQTVADFYAPRAIDADGHTVAATMTVDADSLELEVSHSDPGVSYPVAVTVGAGSFVSAAASQSTSVTPGIDGVNAQLTGETSHAASLGLKVLRQHVLWCQLEPEEGVYNRNQLQSIVDRVYDAHDGDNLRTLVVLNTAAPVFARTAAMHDVSQGMPCAHDGSGAASIASGGTNRYGTAMWKLALCLNGDSRCNNYLSCSPAPNCTVDMHGAMLDNGWVYGFEAGNEPNTTNFWQNDPVHQRRLDEHRCHHRCGADEADAPKSFLRLRESNLDHRGWS